MTKLHPNPLRKPVLNPGATCLCVSGCTPTLLGENRSYGLGEVAGNAISFLAAQMDGDEVKDGGETNHRLLLWASL
jgi:hypothetical protein